MQAVRWTVLLAMLAFVGGGVVGLVLRVLRVSKRRLLRAIAIAYIKLFQGTPLLMQLYLVYFGANLLGLQADAWLAAALGLTFYTSAFLGEIWRGCIQAIPRGQWDGARALALGPLLELRLVILPQAFRIAIPPTVGLHGPGAEGHIARLDHRLRRAHARGADGQQRHVPAVHRLRPGRAALFPAVLAVVGLQPSARAAARSRAPRPAKLAVQ